MLRDRFIVFLIGAACGTQAFAAVMYFNPPTEPPGKTVLIQSLEWLGCKRTPPSYETEGRTDG
jgi:hypothetical protein